MKVGVVGSRIYTDRTFIFDVLDRLHSFSKIQTIVSGGAAGPDSYGQQWGEENSVQTLIFIPQYKLYGKSAPFRRNTEIVQNSDIIIAFWDGASSGTKDTINKAKKANKKIKIYGIMDVLPT